MKEEEKMYRYVMCGMIYEKGMAYFLDFPSPIIYKTEEEAKRDQCTARLEFENREVVLKVYPGENFALEEDERRGKYLRVWTVGEPIAMYGFDELKKQPGFYMGVIKEECKNKRMIEQDDILEKEVPFNEIFPDAKEGFRHYWDNEAYYILETEE